MVETVFDYPNICAITRNGESDGRHVRAVTFTHTDQPCSLDLSQRTVYQGGGKSFEALGEISFPPNADVQNDDLITADGETYRVKQCEKLRDPYGILIEIHVFLEGS